MKSRHFSISRQSDRAESLPEALPSLIHSECSPQWRSLDGLLTHSTLRWCKPSLFSFSLESVTKRASKKTIEETTQIDWTRRSQTQNFPFFDPQSSDSSKEPVLQRPQISSFWRSECRPSSSIMTPKKWISGFEIRKRPRRKENQVFVATLNSRWKSDRIVSQVTKSTP